MKPSKMRERLIEEADMARLSRVLVELKQDCTLPMALDDFELGEIPREPLDRLSRDAWLYQPAAAARRRQWQPRTGHRPQSCQAGQPGRAGFARRQPPAAARTARDRSPRLSLRPDTRRARRLDRAGLRGSPRRRRHRNLFARFDRRRSSSASAWRWGRTMPAISRSGMAAPTCSPRSPSRSAATRRSRRLKPLLESDAVLEGRAEHQIRSQRPDARR